MRKDESLRHWRSARFNRYKGTLSLTEERDNQIESEVVRFLYRHGLPVNAELLLEHLPQRTLGDIAPAELEILLGKSKNLVESSPKMFKLADLVNDRFETSFDPLPISSGTQLESLIHASSTLGRHTQTRLFKEYAGFKLMASFETWQDARIGLDEIIDRGLEEVLSKRRWSIRKVYKYAVSSEPVPVSSESSEFSIEENSRVLTAVIAGELLERVPLSNANANAAAIWSRLLIGNLKLVAREARVRAHGDFLTFSELFQIGTIGLITALEKFDPFRGYQFSTYAFSWIRQAITREQADLNRVIRLPVHLVEQINRVLSRRRDMELRIHRIPTIVELADKLNDPPDRIRDLIELANPPLSLDSLLEDQSSGIENQLMIHNLPKCVEGESLSQRLTWNALDQVLMTLSEREEEIIKRRFGLGGRDPQTLEKIGQFFGVSRERIRQIEAKALRKLRHPTRTRKLRDLLYASDRTVLDSF